MTKRVEPIAKETALEIYRRQIEHHGGMDGVRDEGLLEAALAQPWQGFGEVELYPSIEEKAARLAYEVISQHPFADGNKRTGTQLMMVLLRANDIRFKPRANELLAVIVGVADGSLSYEELVAFVRGNVER